MREDHFNPTEQFATFVDLLRWRAIQHPNQLAFTFLQDGETNEVQITYGELDRQARMVGAQLQRMGLYQECALLLYPSGLEFIIAFLGCLYAGVVAVPMYPPRPNRSMSRLQGITADASATVALASAQVLSSIEHRFIDAPDLAALHWLDIRTFDDVLAEEWRKPALNSNTLAFLQYTSGSTNMPKGVMVSHRNILYNERMIQMAFEHTEQLIYVGWLPLYHDMGLIGTILQNLYVGGQMVLMPPAAFIQKPFRWLQAISNYKATTSGAPNFAYDLCVRQITPEQRATLDLSSWSVAFNGAEPVRRETLEQFAATFAPCGFRKEALYPCYGLAEATVFVAGGDKTHLPVIQTVQALAFEQHKIIAATNEDQEVRSLVGCGRTWLDQKIVIVDPESATTCSYGQIGEIWVSGPNVAQGYWNKPEQTDRDFRAFTDTGEGPFLRTGDLGFLKDGELFVTGRIKDKIIIHGRNYYPQDIEFTVEQSHPKVRQGCSAAFSIEVAGEERLVVVAEVDRRIQQPQTDDVLEAIRQAIAEQHGLDLHAISLLRQGSILKTTSGKIQRQACKAGFLADNLTVVTTWSRGTGDTHPVEQSANNDAMHLLEMRNTQAIETIQAWLVERVAELLHIAPHTINVRKPFTSYSLNSLDAVRIMRELETRFGRQLPPTFAYEYLTIEALAAYLALANSETLQVGDKLFRSVRTSRLPLSVDE